MAKTAVLISTVLLVLVGSFACAGEPTPAPPLYLPLSEAASPIPFPIQAPTYIPEGYEMEEKGLVLQGKNYGYESKGVLVTLKKYTPSGYENIYIRQFLAEGTFPPARFYNEGILSFESVNLGGFNAEAREIFSNETLTVVEWETEHEGQRVFWSVTSEVNKDEALKVVRSLTPVAGFSQP